PGFHVQTQFQSPIGTAHILSINLPKSRVESWDLGKGPVPATALEQGWKLQLIPFSWNSNSLRLLCNPFIHPFAYTD
ncbi:MAG TPA: hypothetical protein VLA71_06555, partial [Algoriphagus sp.]|nr:hypothetical protein [Algoriphagus sp.]